jgi:hypothetical protein
LDNNEFIPSRDIFQLLKPFPIDLVKVYPKSFRQWNGLIYGLLRTPEGKKLIVIGEKDSVLSDPFEGTFHQGETALKLCDLSPQNTSCLMSLFPSTKPVSLRKYPMTVETGNHFALAIPGHIRALEKFDMVPILVQQSVKENMQTGQSLREKIQDAAWAVFQENYQKGYGADGNRITSLEEVRSAIDAGVSMISLDLSEKLIPEAMDAPKEWVDRRFQREIDSGDAEVLIHLFTGKEFHFKGPYGELSVQFDEETAKRNILLFHLAIDFSEEVYDFIRLQTGYRDIIDFGISIDKTPFATSPENHLFLIIALSHRGVRMDFLAPRFAREFQNGVDLPGDLKGFGRQFYQHLLIARDYGCYKISIDSGSDKSSFFPIVTELGGGLHLKIDGPYWLEAMHLISLKDPNLYTQIQNTSNRKGIDLFRERLERTLTECEEDYWSLLEQHIENHLLSVGLRKHISTLK